MAQTGMTSIVNAIRAEFLQYKTLAERAIDQLGEADLTIEPAPGANSVAVICWHISGNLRSRFTDFLTSDGEKPWRRRDEEFEVRMVTRAELTAKWDQGWDVLLSALATLTDDHLHLTVTIRGQSQQVHQALRRSLAHISYHVGQIVYVAKSVRGADWRSLSIPPGQSEAYNRMSPSQREAARPILGRRDDESSPGGGGGGPRTPVRS